jgi:hypothetical protein
MSRGSCVQGSDVTPPELVIAGSSAVSTGAAETEDASSSCL